MLHNGFRIHLQKWLEVAIANPKTTFDVMLVHSKITYTSNTAFCSKKFIRARLLTYAAYYKNELIIYYISYVRDAITTILLPKVL